MQYFLASFLLLSCLTGFAQPRRVCLPNTLKEVSGIACNTSDTVWAINDGGNAPIIYQLERQTGKVIRQDTVPFPNIDWEDLQTDARGRLWVADIGNNLSTRRRLVFYCYNPLNGDMDSLWFAYPDQRNFSPKQETDRKYDAEAFVWLEDTLHIFTKSRFKGDHFTRHYSVAAYPGAQMATLRDSFYWKNRAVSGAALSAEGNTLVLIGYYFQLRKYWLPYTRASACFFTNFKGNTFFKGKKSRQRLPRFLIARQFESVTHVTGKQWLLANEGIMWQKQRLWRFKGKY